jgi:hypothetical protein
VKDSEGISERFFGEINKNTLYGKMDNGKLIQLDVKNYTIDKEGNVSVGGVLSYKKDIQLYDVEVYSAFKRTLTKNVKLDDKTTIKVDIDVYPEATVVEYDVYGYMF